MNSPPKKPVSIHLLAVGCILSFLLTSNCRHIHSVLTFWITEVDAFNPQWQWISNKLFWQWFERCSKTSMCMSLCSYVSCLGIHLAHSLWSLICCRWFHEWNHARFSTSLKVTLLLFRIVAQAQPVFSSAVYMDGRLGHSESVTPVLTFLTC